MYGATEPIWRVLAVIKFLDLIKFTLMWIRLLKPYTAISREAVKDIAPNIEAKKYGPVLCFIDETREYLAGKLRKGETVSGEEAAIFIAQIKSYLPGCV
jgi:hypothetical protein